MLSVKLNKWIAASGVMMLIAALFTACLSAPEPVSRSLGNGWEAESSMKLEYAENFNVDFYSGELALLTISDGSRFLIVPEDGFIPADIDADIVVLKQPITDIYLAASASMSLFDALGSLDNITLSGIQADSWYIENAKQAMENGDIRFAGKYSKPDYEMILASDCRLAIESNMISHAPEVKEKLEALGIPVLVDQSSYEPHPLGRTEWIKVYGALTGRAAQAEAIFDEQTDYLDALTGLDNTGKTVAFFYISSSGSAVTRKSGDYVTKMIDLAGGNYIFDELGDSEAATSTVTLEMETFYAEAKDADFIIYNSTIDGGINTVDELIAKNALLADFKAVQNGQVWCTEQNLYQETTQLGLMISDIHTMLVSNGELNKLNFLYKLD